MKQKSRKNLRANQGKTEKVVSANNQPSWYKQLFDMPEEKRIEQFAKVMELLKEAKPDAYEFIKKFQARHVGFIPNIVYTMPDDSRGFLQVNFVHEFSQSTLLFWNKEGGMGFFINPSLNFDDEMGFTY